MPPPLSSYVNDLLCSEVDDDSDTLQDGSEDDPTVDDLADQTPDTSLESVQKATKPNVTRRTAPKRKRTQMLGGIDESNILTISDDSDDSDGPIITRRTTRQRVNGPTDANYDQKLHPMDEFQSPAHWRRRLGLLGPQYDSEGPEPEGSKTDELQDKTPDSDGKSSRFESPPKAPNRILMTPVANEEPSVRTPDPKAIRKSQRPAASKLVEYRTTHHPQDAQLYRRRPRKRPVHREEHEVVVVNRRSGTQAWSPCREVRNDDGCFVTVQAVDQATAYDSDMLSNIVVGSGLMIDAIKIESDHSDDSADIENCDGVDEADSGEDIIINGEYDDKVEEENITNGGNDDMVDPLPYRLDEVRQYVAETLPMMASHHPNSDEALRAYHVQPNPTPPVQTIDPMMLDLGYRRDSGVECNGNGHVAVDKEAHDIGSARFAIVANRIDPVGQGGNEDDAVDSQELENDMIAICSAHRLPRSTGKTIIEDSQDQKVAQQRNNEDFGLDPNNTDDNSTNVESDIPRPHSSPSAQTHRKEFSVQAQNLLGQSQMPHSDPAAEEESNQTVVSEVDAEHAQNYASSDTDVLVDVSSAYKAIHTTNTAVEGIGDVEDAAIDSEETQDDTSDRQNSQVEELAACAVTVLDAVSSPRQEWTPLTSQQET